MKINRINIDLKMILLSSSFNLISLENYKIIKKHLKHSKEIHMLHLEQNFYTNVQKRFEN